MLSNYENHLYRTHSRRSSFNRRCSIYITPARPVTPVLTSRTPERLSFMPISNDTNQYTLEGFGELSDASMIACSDSEEVLPSQSSPIQITGVGGGLRVKKPKPRHRIDAEISRPLPSLIRKMVQPPSPTQPAVSSSSEVADFFKSFLVNSGSAARHSRSTKLFSGRAGSHTPDKRALQPVDATVRASVPRGTARQKAEAKAERSKAEDRNTQVEPKAVALAERPLRGNAPLPRRPPIPRWDLMDPIAYSEDHRAPQMAVLCN